jgi:hypothetical protein
MAARQSQTRTQDDIFRVAKLLLNPHTLGIQPDHRFGAQMTKAW